MGLAMGWIEKKWKNNGKKIVTKVKKKGFGYGLNWKKSEKK